jgi:TPP-dependent pyruvate/acetoin dehydrogenase alpha subunit
MGVPIELAEAETDIVRKAQGYGIAGEQVDGMNPVEVEVAARSMVAAIRAQPGPRFLECRTYRFRAHSMFDAQHYRTKAEVESWQARDPIARLEEWLIAGHLLSREELGAIDAAIAAEIAAAVAFAEAGTLEPVADLERFVTMDAVPQ